MLRTHAELQRKVASLFAHIGFLPTLEKHAQDAVVVRAKRVIAEGCAVVLASDVQNLLGASYSAPPGGVTIESLFAHFDLRGENAAESAPESAAKPEREPFPFFELAGILRA